MPEEKPKEPKVDPVIFALSNFSANQSYYALVGIIGWASHEAGLLSFLFSLKKEYRNPWMQILLQSIGCFEIAGKSSKIQQEVYKADPSLVDGLKLALLDSLKPELKDDILAIIDSVSSFLTKA